MSSVEVSVRIDASPEQVWEEVRHIDRHVEWMADAVSITFTGDQTSGVGTTFDTYTRIGPLSTTDTMTVTEWVDNEAMGVRHVGAVTGEGRFTLAPDGDGTTFTWSEELTLPWYFGGPIGSIFATPIFKVIWNRNLKGLKERVEAQAAAGA